MDWTAEVITRLRGLWAEGHSTAEIGRRMGVSKNSVVGKAHRLSLPARPSPIRRGSAGQTPKPTMPRRTTGPTLPPLATQNAEALQTERAALQLQERGQARDAGFTVPSHTVTPPASRPRLAPLSPSMTHSLGVPSVAPSIAHSAAPSAAYGGSRRHIACCWPIGEPGTRSFRFCDAQSVAGKPYCAQHAALAYVKVRDRREEAA